MGRPPKNEYTSLARAAREQIARAAALGKSLDVRLKVAREAAPDWTPNEDWRRDFAAVTNSIQHAGNAMDRALQSGKKDTDGLSTEQIEAQFKAELVASAQTLSDEEWNAMIAARAKARR